MVHRGAEIRYLEAVFTNPTTVEVNALRCRRGFYTSWKIVLGGGSASAMSFATESISFAFDSARILRQRVVLDELFAAIEGTVHTYKVTDVASYRCQEISILLLH